MKIGIIGLGKLGLPVAEVISGHHQVTGYDINTINNSNFKICDSIKEAVVDQDIVFIAVQTPHDSAYGGEKPTSHLVPKDFDYSIVQSVLKEIDLWASSKQLIVLISTVLPGTIRKQLKPLLKNGKFIYNPYLIAMSSVKYDFVHPEMVIIGNESGEKDQDVQKLIEFYKTMMKNDTRYECGTWDEAEAIKIFYNTFISSKIGLVNMIQDVAEKNGHINVDVVTDAIAKSTQRIMGSAYMRAGMGDGGPCHPRDNIALSWLAKNLELGYDIFGAIMHAREQQAKILAQRLLSINSRVLIVGKAYKPGVSLTSGSYSLLVGHYLEELGGSVAYYDPNTGDNSIPIWKDCVYLIGYWEEWVKNYPYLQGSTILDPWRKHKTLSQHPSVKIIHYGNTRVPNLAMPEPQVSSELTL